MIRNLYSGFSLILSEIKRKTLFPKKIPLFFLLAIQAENLESNRAAPLSRARLWGKRCPSPRRRLGIDVGLDASIRLHPKLPLDAFPSCRAPAPPYTTA